VFDAGVGALLSEVEEHGSSISNPAATTLCPLSAGETTNAITLFYLEKIDGRTSLIASRVEIIIVPPMLRSSITDSSSYLFVTEESK
jgi:hypothetical protein